MKQAVAYLRCSTNMQDQSIPDQRKAILDFAETHGYKVVDCFIDEGISGVSVDKRDSFNRLMKTVENADKSIEYILVYDISRWGRFPDSDESAYWEYHWAVGSGGDFHQ